MLGAGRDGSHTCGRGCWSGDHLSGQGRRHQLWKEGMDVKCVLCNYTGDMRINVKTEKKSYAWMSYEKVPVMGSEDNAQVTVVVVMVKMMMVMAMIMMVIVDMIMVNMVLMLMISQ